ncbi:Hypothetical protein D9617_21g097590 [Elsinoe fawcettii]|nr:Hypothetical protein D9617_21g097590 [Elsinoe fawcettii]
MLSLKTFIFLAPLSALAAPLEQLTTEVRVVWTRQVSDGATVLKVFTRDSTAMLAESTTTKINGGMFASQPLSVEVDDKGVGILRLGDKTYNVHTDRDQSGGMKCTRMYTPQQALVDCMVPWQGDLGLVKRSPMKDAATLRAEMNVGVLPAFQDLPSHSKRDIAMPFPYHDLTPPPIFNETRHSKRQCEPWPVQDTVIHGDGFPHQNYFHQQKTSTARCAQNTCTISHSKSDTFTIGWSASFPVFKWIGGGFNVGMSWTEGETLNCAGQPGESVCVWHNAAHTAYTVENWTSDDVCMNNERMDHLSIIKSPNDRNRGGNLYCVVGTCRAVTDNYWDNTPVPGGPRGEISLYLYKHGCWQPRWSVPGDPDWDLTYQGEQITMEPRWSELSGGRMSISLLHVNHEARQLTIKWWKAFYLEADSNTTSAWLQLLNDKPQTYRKPFQKDQDVIYIAKDQWIPFLVEATNRAFEDDLIQRTISTRLDRTCVAVDWEVIAGKAEGSLTDLLDDAAYCAPRQIFVVMDPESISAEGSRAWTVEKLPASWKWTAGQTDFEECSPSRNDPLNNAGTARRIAQKIRSRAAQKLLALKSSTALVLPKGEEREQWVMKHAPEACRALVPSLNDNGIPDMEVHLVLARSL